MNNKSFLQNWDKMQENLHILVYDIFIACKFPQVINFITKILSKIKK